MRRNKQKMKKVNNANTTIFRKKEKGITLIALIITIIILIVLAAVTIAALTGEHGILKNLYTAKEEHQKQSATELMNLKITGITMKSYAERGKLATLQILADGLCEDNEIEYVLKKSKQIASLDKIDVSDTSSIFTKLTDYPYEFEINGSLQLASINGVKIATNTKDDEMDRLTKRIEELESKLENINILETLAPEGVPQLLGTYYPSDENHETIAPDNGWILFAVGSEPSSSPYIVLNVGPLRATESAAIWANAACSLPCKKGQKITCYFQGSKNAAKLYFIPMK